MPGLDAFTPLPNATMQGPMLAPVPYMPAPIAAFSDYQPQYPMMDQTSDIDLVSRAPAQTLPPSAAIHGVGASYNLNNTSSLSSPSDVPIAQVKQEDAIPKERVVGNMLRNIAHVMKTAGDACHSHQAIRPITPGDEQKTKYVIAQINELIHGMGLPTTNHIDVSSRKRHAGDLKDGEQPVKKIPKPEPQDVVLDLGTGPCTFVRTHTVSRSQPSSRPHTPPLTVKPVPSNFRPSGFLGLLTTPLLFASAIGLHIVTTTPDPWAPFQRDIHGTTSGSSSSSSPSSAPAGRMGRTGYFLPEHGWSSSSPITAMPGVSATDVVDEEDEDNDAEDDNDSASPSGSIHSTYPDGLISGSDIPQEYRAEVDRVFIKYLNRICSNLDAADNKGDPIHQQLMPKKMQKLDESTDFRPFKFRIQAFTAAFLEEARALADLFHLS
ncbi:hypothetical protein B0H14DRAFT_3543099 [Mycena olivaceomarginata]|nr:hypothetical protein B0H14DRAFT_3543099 [Mycena olivaceomarginata]